MTHFSVDIMMLELPTDIDLLLTFRNENSNTFQQNRIGQSYQLDSRAPVVFKDTDFKAGVGNYKNSY
jgi:hypothetical protein